MNQFKNSIDIFYYTTNLPIQLLKNNQVLYSHPKTVETLQQNLENSLITDCLPDLKQNYKNLFYLSSSYFENFIAFFTNNGTTILVGPFIINKPKHSEILQLIHMQNIPLQKSSYIASYFSSLKIINNKQYFYTGKFLEALFSSTSGVRTEISDSQEMDDTLIQLPKSLYRQILRDDDMQFVHAPYFFEKNMSSSIMHGDLQAANEILNEINMLPRAKLAFTPLRSLKNSLIASCTFMTRATIDGGVSPDTAFLTSDILIRKIEEINEIDKLEAFERSMVKALVELVNQTNEVHYSKLIRNCIDYIVANLTESLTVKKIALQVFTNPNYLSTQFKKEVGIPITHFIQTKRLHEACFALRYTDTKISDIAIHYLFSSQSYFDKVFKEHHKMTPNEYRNRTMLNT